MFLYNIQYIKNKDQHYKIYIKSAKLQNIYSFHSFFLRASYPFSRLRHVGRLVVRLLSIVAWQQFPARGQRFPQPATIGQHADDPQDPDSSVVRLLAGRYTWQRAAYATSLEHWAAGAAGIHHQFVTANCKLFVSGSAQGFSFGFGNGFSFSFSFDFWFYFCFYFVAICFVAAIVYCGFSPVPLRFIFCPIFRVCHFDWPHRRPQKAWHYLTFIENLFDIYIYIFFMCALSLLCFLGLAFPAVHVPCLTRRTTLYTTATTTTIIQYI